MAKRGCLRWPDQVVLIDFDLAGIGNVEALRKSGTAADVSEITMRILSTQKYPIGFAEVLSDGKRHPDAKSGSKLAFAHDVYACGGLLSLVCCSESDARVTAEINHVANGLMQLETPLTLSVAASHLLQYATVAVQFKPGVKSKS